jgi:hypothetical protein
MPRTKASTNRQSPESLRRTNQTTLDTHVLRNATESPATESSATERASDEVLTTSDDPPPVTPAAEASTSTEVPTTETHETAPSTAPTISGSEDTIEWIRPSYGDETALGRGLFPFKRTGNNLLIQDLHLHGTVTLVDLKPGVSYNHVVDIEVNAAEIAKVKDFAYTYSGLPTEASGKIKWKDTPIRNVGNVIHFVNKKDLEVAFTDVWDARGADDPLEIEPDQRTELDWSEVKRSCRVLVEAIPEIYFRSADAIPWGVTLHMVTVGLLADAGSQPNEQAAISFQSPKKKRKVSQIKTEPVEDTAE